MNRPPEKKKKHKKHKVQEETGETNMGMYQLNLYEGQQVTTSCREALMRLLPCSGQTMADHDCDHDYDHERDH